MTLSGGGCEVQIGNKPDDAYCISRYSSTSSQASLSFLAGHNTCSYSVYLCNLLSREDVVFL